MIGSSAGGFVGASSLFPSASSSTWRDITLARSSSSAAATAVPVVPRSRKRIQSESYI